MAPTADPTARRLARWGRRILVSLVVAAVALTVGAVTVARLGGTATDIFAWHYYPQQSRRGPVASRRAAPGRLLDANNLDEAAHWADHNVTTVMVRVVERK